MNENEKYCESIAYEIENIVGGYTRRCPECGAMVTREWDDVGDKFRCPECKEVSDTDEWDQKSLWGYFDDALDIEYRVGGRGPDGYRSVVIMVACGGPNIYVDTGSGLVELYWWSERANWPLSRDAVDMIDEWASECWALMCE